METAVSIVTVSLNAAKTIQDTLDSVSQQEANFRIEHICIDGGSTDGTRELISQATAHNKNLVTLFEPDTGLFDAMNKGIRLALGRYILFLNSDDFLIGTSSVSDAFARIDLSSDAPDMVMGDVVMAHLNRFSLWRMRRVPRWLPKYPGLGMHPPHQGNFISRQLLLRAGGFESNQSLAADTTQFYRLVYEFSPKIAVSRTTVSFMRMGGASNKTLASFRKGNRETYRYLRRYRSPLGAAIAVAIKVSQKLFELRLGRVPKSALTSTRSTQRKSGLA
jgi:glycosyltransferase involved in cell wall biosynthesis